MKKTILALAAGVAVLSMASCSSKQEAKDAKEEAPKTEVYSGILPAADAAGVKYTLKLDYANDSTYDLTQATMLNDSTVSDAKDATVKTKGRFDVMDKDASKYIKLMAEAKDSTAASESMCFLVQSDSTLVMVNSSLQPGETPGLNYTLTLEK